MARIQIPFPSVIPLANAKSVLFTTHPKAPGLLPYASAGLVGPTVPELNIGDLHLLEFTWFVNDQASATNGIRVYTRSASGTSWYEVDVKDDNGNATVGSGAPSGGISLPIVALGAERHWALVTSRYPLGVAVELTEGAVQATVRDGVFVAHTRIENVGL